MHIQFCLLSPNNNVFPSRTSRALALFWTSASLFKFAPGCELPSASNPPRSMNNNGNKAGL